MLNKLTMFFLLASILAGCSSSPDIRPGMLASIPTGKKVSLNNSSAVKNKLYEQHKNWKGVKYKMGGLSKNGIDCSGFVYRTFKSQLGIELPRTTEQQLSIGEPISKKDLRAGDLLFFKTAKKVRHVGIYIEDNKFLHASTSKGVMISDLNNVYWKSKYWQTKRP